MINFFPLEIKLPYINTRLIIIYGTSINYLVNLYICTKGLSKYAYKYIGLTDKLGRFCNY